MKRFDVSYRLKWSQDAENGPDACSSVPELIGAVGLSILRFFTWGSFSFRSKARSIERSFAAAGTAQATLFQLWRP